MYITIPERGNLPSSEIFTKIIRKNHLQNFIWDREVIVLIHGGPGGNHTLYADIEESLLEIADLVLVDLRGCGLSKKIDAKFCTLDVHIDDLQFILETLSVQNPIIHGCSYGAIVALGFAIRYPNTPQKLILSSCVASGDFIEHAKEHLKQIGTEQQINVAEKLWTGTFNSPEQFNEYYRIMAPLYFFNEPSLPASIQNIPYNIELVNLAFTTFLKTFDFRNKLSKINYKTLIFSGKNDWIFDNEQAYVLHQGIKNSILISLNDCGHFPWKDQRKKFLSFLHTFIEEKADQKQHHVIC